MRCKGTAFFCICKIFRQKNMFFLAFFLKITAFSYFFTRIAISTLQYDMLNRGYWLLLCVLPYLCTFAARKIIFAVVFYICMCACTLYIGETSRSVLFAVCSRLFLFSFSFCFTKFVCV